MRLLFVADGRSPITRGWVRHWVERGDEVFLVSTFACDTGLPVRAQFHVPVAFSSARTATPGPLGSARHIGLRTRARQWLGPLTIPLAARRLREIVARVKPDVVHAMRIPYEDMLAAGACGGAPLVVSVWGNDFTLHGPSTPLMRALTRRVLAKAAALHADCHRDIRLAHDWGLARDKPTLVTPCGGGIRLDVFRRATTTAPVVINPRGFRGYVRNDTFFQAIPLVRARRPDARFLCVAMAGEDQAVEWARSLGVSDAVDLLPHLRPEEMAAAFRSAQVLVSPTVHDGTPNSLLEGMASGCFPVAGDLESIREWITPGVNGTLVDPGSPEQLAGAIVAALNDPGLRSRVAATNRDMIAERAEYRHCVGQAARFYRDLHALSVSPRAHG